MKNKYRTKKNRKNKNYKNNKTYKRKTNKRAGTKLNKVLVTATKQLIKPTNVKQLVPTTTPLITNYALVNSNVSNNKKNNYDFTNNKSQHEKDIEIVSDMADFVEEYFDKKISKKPRVGDIKGAVQSGLKTLVEDAIKKAENDVKEKINKRIIDIPEIDTPNVNNNDIDIERQKIIDTEYLNSLKNRISELPESEEREMLFNTWIDFSVSFDKKYGMPLELEEVEG